MKISVLLSCLLALPVYGLELKLELCQKLETPITDLEFLTNSEFLISSKTGELFLGQGCGKKAITIKRFDVKTNSELGLLGIAVDLKKINEKDNPGGTQSLYLYYSPASGGKTFTRLSAFNFSRNKKEATLSEERILLEISQPFDNHDGGALKIGVDGSLYLGVGDGGAGGDPHNNGQNIKTLLGSIVRIHPDKSKSKGYRIPKGNLSDFKKGAMPEILAMGLRNPWKFAFDNAGNLIVADVGQNKIEEISIISASSIGSVALNLGWRLKEGGACFNPEKNCTSPGLLEPIYQYGRDFGSSITGGETLVFEGKEYYLFADYVSGEIAALNLSSPEKLTARHTMRGSNWTTFGKSPNGEVYIANIAGDIYKVIPVKP